MTRRQALSACAGAVTSFAAVSSGPKVSLRRVPESGIQPQVAVDGRGGLHLVYYTGDAHAGNLFYVKSPDGGASFSAAVAVNARSGSAIAAGTIRGAQVAAGRDGRVHVAWNGSGADGPMNADSGKPGAPMLYTRMNDAGNGFEAARNLMLHSFGLDGGGSLTADAAGNVHVAWHGVGERDVKAGKGEARRALWITSSHDDGRTFAAEHKAWNQPTGACGCCGTRVFSTREGTLLGLYRSATEQVHRDIYLVSSNDAGRTFKGQMVQKWDINACPMSSMDIAENAGLLVGAWETSGQVYRSRLDALKPVAAPGTGKVRKHPRLAINGNGETLLVWTEGTGWQRGGSFAWQVYDRAGQPVGAPKQMAGIPVWSFAAPVSNRDGSFSILY